MIILLKIKYRIGALKRFIAILFFLTLLIYSGGYFLIYAYQKMMIRQEVSTMLHSDHSVAQSFLTNFSFPSENFEQNKIAHFHWTEEGKEFSYDGHLYDVVSLHCNGSNTIITCINDKEETRLEDRLVKMSDNFNKKVNAKIPLILKLVSSNFICPQHASIYSVASQTVVHNLYPVNTFISIAPAISIPPPKGVFSC
jgi:hypothetical protein